MPLQLADRFEAVFFSASRPVKVQVRIGVAGKPLAERLEATWLKLFQAADRDGDGVLNQYEKELIFSRAEFAKMLRGGFGFRGATGELPTLDQLDENGDRIVNLSEFKTYYTDASTQVIQIRYLSADIASSSEKYTQALFARLDQDRDNRLSETELKNAEQLLLAQDTDEDEQLSLSELLAAGSAARPRLDAGSSPGSMMMMKTITKKDNLQSMGDLQVFPGAIPARLVAELLKHYDANGDKALSRGEIGWDRTEFDRFDTNRNGQLSAVELEPWRTREADLLLTLTTGERIEDCKAELKPGAGCPHQLTIPEATTPDRVVLHIGSQTMDFAAVPMPKTARTQVHPYSYLFPSGKKALRERDLIGPEYQFLRITFDFADRDSDGQLTRQEFDEYFEQQLHTQRLGLTLNYTTAVPSLFQLLDTNGDMALGVRELRTAYPRLIAFEPAHSKFVTSLVLQPSASLKLGYTVGVSALSNVTEEQRLPFSRKPADMAQAGPVWFRKMDRNGDGDVSKSEFLGSAEDFLLLDGDRDGLITLEEANRYEGRVRPKNENKQKSNNRASKSVRPMPA